MKCLIPVAILAVTAALLVFEAGAQESSQPAVSPATQPAATQPAGGSSAEDVMRQLMRQRQENPVIDPSQRPGAEPAQGTQVRADPRVLGVAPGQEAPKLRREGEFIISRRGRIVRAPNSNQLLFAFEADSQHAAEAPMILMPCQMLQNMEQLVTERGDKIVFTVSGQIFTYRGANYLLPTMMRMTVDQGNLQQ